MSRAVVKPAEKLKIQFRKWLNKGYLHNVVLHPTYARSGLPVEETFIADVIDKAGRSIPFTESGFLAPDHGFVRYADIERTHWISKNWDGSDPKDKRQRFDHLELELSDNSTLLLKDLDQAVFPLLKFFEWLQKEKPS
jgi:hypothetical protein